MVRNLMAGDFAGGLGLGNDIEEIVPFRVAKQVLDVAGEPYSVPPSVCWACASKVLVRAWMVSDFMRWRAVVRRLRTRSSG